MSPARSIKVRGVVQGVGFRPFVVRLARANMLCGCVSNGNEGVEIFLEGADRDLDAFLSTLESAPPSAAQITEIEVRTSEPLGLREFTVRDSATRDQPSARISPDLPVCEGCLRELFDPSDQRYLYPYINCTNCGPRYSVILSLPYDRPHTTMKDWQLDPFCAAQYADVGNRRFHAQPIACPSCGPQYALVYEKEIVRGSEAAIRRAAELLQSGGIMAVKGLGGYHLACDARNESAVHALRERKYRKEKPFALMAKNCEVARSVVRLGPADEALLTSAARPIVIARAKAELPGVAPDNHDLGVMLPYTPVHALLFAFDAPDLLVMTSGNRSSEPIAYEDDEALQRLSGIAGAFLMGERRIARRVEDSIARVGVFGPAILRRARGYAPSAVAVFPSTRVQHPPLLAVGADLKNTVTLVVHGQAFVGQHNGDLSQHQAFESFKKSVEDLTSMYDLRLEDLLVAHDSHPQYASTGFAEALSSPEKCSIQHHRAHIASVLAEAGAWTKRVIGVSFDGTGYGDDGSIWGGELFAGSLSHGFVRVAHLRPAQLAGGDAAARYPVQAAAGFLLQIDGAPDVTAAPFNFPRRYENALTLIDKGVRTFTTTSMGRLFDTAAALLGFTREVSFEGQAAIWLEQLARNSPPQEPYPFPFENDQLDFRPLLKSVATDRLRGRDPAHIACAFHQGIAQGLCDAVTRLCSSHSTDAVALSGGVFQNELLLQHVQPLFSSTPLKIYTNHAVPSNDGGISLGQAALAWFGWGLDDSIR